MNTSKSNEQETLEETVNNEEETNASKHGQENADTDSETNKAAVFKKKKLFSCEECGKTYESDRGLRGHKQKHRMLNSQAVPVVSAVPGVVSTSSDPGVVSTVQIQEDSNVEYLREEVNYVIENGVEGVDYDTVEIIVQ